MFIILYLIFTVSISIMYILVLNCPHNMQYHNVIFWQGHTGNQLVRCVLLMLCKRYSTYNCCITHHYSSCHYTAFSVPSETLLVWKYSMCQYCSYLCAFHIMSRCCSVLLFYIIMQYHLNGD